MIDYSIEIPDLCWLNICQYLSIGDIAQFSSTCRTLRHMLWSHESSLWMYLIHLKVQSSIFCQSIKVLCDQDENEDAIIAENDQLSQRLLSDTKAYEAMHENFLCPTHYRTWHARLTSAETDKRGFIAWRRFVLPYPIPLSNYPIPLSSTLFRLYYYR